MKRILLLIIVFFNLLPVIKNKQLSFCGPTSALATCNTGGEITGSNNGDNYGDTGEDYYDSDNPFPLGTGMEIHDAANSLQTVLNNFSTNTWDVRVVGNYIVVTYTPLDAPSTVVFQGNSDQAAATYGFLANVPINTGNQYDDDAPIQFDACGEPIDPASFIIIYTPPDPGWIDPFDPGNGGGGGGGYNYNDNSTSNSNRKDTIKTQPRDSSKPCLTDTTLTLTKELILKMYPNANKKITDSVVKYLNQYMGDYQINTRLRLAHLLAQMLAETGGFNTTKESWHYTTKGVLFDNFKDRKKINDSNYTHYLNCICLFDMYYAGNGTNHQNGDSASTDGSTYLGRGAIQLTHRDSYYNFTQYYQKKYSDYTLDAEANPDLIITNMKLFTLSALWEFSIDKSVTGHKYNALIDSDNDKIDKVTFVINGGSNGIFERKDALKNIKILLCL